MHSICKGCGGEQCQLCRQNAKTIESCCSEPVASVTANLEMCKAKAPQNPCEGLSGAQFSQCAWEQDVKTCLETNCQGCGGEQCQLCRADAGTDFSMAVYQKGGIWEDWGDGTLLLEMLGRCKSLGNLWGIYWEELQDWPIVVPSQAQGRGENQQLL